MVYTNSRLYDVMDDNGDVSMMCSYCNIEREELYMGGGLWVYKCPKCNSRMEWKNHENTSNKKRSSRNDKRHV